MKNNIEQDQKKVDLNTGKKPLNNPDTGGDKVFYDDESEDVPGNEEEEKVKKEEEEKNAEGGDKESGINDIAGETYNGLEVKEEVFTEM